MAIRQLSVKLLACRVDIVEQETLKLVACGDSIGSRPNGSAHSERFHIEAEVTKRIGGARVNLAAHSVHEERALHRDLCHAPRR